MKIDLVLTDDWEIRGDGSGNMRVMQFAQIRRLMDIYEREGLKGSFYAEVMQQLAHLGLSGKHPELRSLASEWEELVQETLQRGHDIQLHLHPQWRDGRYEHGRWQLPGSWSLLEYPAEEVVEMVREGKEYLEAVLQRVKRTYECVSFRSSAWAVAPSEHMLPILVGERFVFDSSISEGIFFDTRKVYVDYRVIDEPFLPYYPELHDARRVAPRRQAIVCVPTYSFRSSLARQILARLASRMVGHRLARSTPLIFKHGRPCDAPIADETARRSHTAEFWHESRTKRARRVIRLLRSPRTADLCALSFSQMHEMLASMRRRARATGFDRVPVVLANHTKSVGDFAPIEAFAREVGRSPDLNVITLSELAARLQDGVYPIRTAT
jgi:hypothetical protein